MSLSRQKEIRDTPELKLHEGIKAGSVTTTECEWVALCSTSDTVIHKINYALENSPIQHSIIVVRGQWVRQGLGLTPDPCGPLAQNCPPRMSRRQGNRPCPEHVELAGPVPENYAAYQPLRNALCKTTISIMGHPCLKKFGMNP